MALQMNDMLTGRLTAAIEVDADLNEKHSHHTQFVRRLSDSLDNLLTRLGHSTEVPDEPPTELPSVPPEDLQVSTEPMGQESKDSDDTALGNVRLTPPKVVKLLAQFNWQTQEVRGESCTNG